MYELQVSGALGHQGIQTLITCLQHLSGEEYGDVRRSAYFNGEFQGFGSAYRFATRLPRERVESFSVVINKFANKSGSRTRSPASGPLRTVHAPFGAHGSSLHKGIVRHPVTPLHFQHKYEVHGN
jgi:hypothetical protein